MRRPLPFLLLAIATAWAPPTRPTPIAPPVNTTETDIAPDALADTLLVNVQSVDPTITVDLRYATANNFTGSPLPGYQANRAYLRREAGVALVKVQRYLRSSGLGLKIFDAYRPVRATLAMVDWTERVHRTDLLKDGYIASRYRHKLGFGIEP